MTAPVTLDKLARQMSPAATDRLDFSRLFKVQACLNGDLDVSQCARLVDALADNTGQIQYKIEFQQDDAGHNVLKSHILSRVQMKCQRCLHNMPITLEVDNQVVLVANLDEAKQLPDEYDSILESETANNLLTLIEDELLLALPFSPLHENEQCKLSEKWVAEKQQGKDRQYPFASLADWQVNKQE